MARNYGNGSGVLGIHRVSPTRDEQVQAARSEAMMRLEAARSRFNEATTDRDIAAAILAVKAAEDNWRAVLAIAGEPMSGKRFKEFRRQLAGDSKGLRMEFVARR